MKKILFATTCIALILRSVTANTISENQQPFVEKYKHQKDVPAPQDMLINTDTEPAIDDSFTNLYNGKNLLGWTTRGGRCSFDAKGEAIEGVCVPGSASTYLCTDKVDYNDFIFTAEIKWLINGNSGILFRSKAEPSGHAYEHVFGPQAEMEGISGGKIWRGWSGGIYGQGYGGWLYPLWLDAHKEVRAALKQDAWNRITIKAEGDMIKTWVNGLPAAHWKCEGFDQGFFGLQVHAGEKGTIQFRNIMVKEL